MTHRADEDYINKSLLDSLDEQADSEPISSSESDHAAPRSYGSTSSSSSGSPTVPYHFSQLAQPFPRPDSPTNSNTTLSTSMSSNQDMYTMANAQNGIFPNVMHANNFEYIPEMDPSKHQLLNQAKLNGYDTNAFRPLSSYPNSLRQRHFANHSAMNPQLRDNFYQNPSADMLGIASPLQSHTSPAFEFGSGQSAANFKQFHDTFGHSNSNVPSSHLLLNGKNVPQHLASNKGFNPGTQYSTSVHLTSQTPFGPHIPVNLQSHVPTGLNGVGSTNPSQNVSNAPVAATGNSTGSGQEEICTIFVVGFPDDMQEREFQNMFTFSQGFEAATLKIPNKDNTTYAGNTGRTYGGSSDPYNLVSVNQGVVEGGRDATTSSWQAAASGDESSGAAQFGNNGNAPPRKQIIGFAKFRTRHEALAAKDHLQGKRIDMEKGAVLKAEMAKKNLHTKRGVGVIPSNSAGPSVTVGNAAALVGMGSSFGVFSQPVMNGLNNTQDSYGVNGTDPMNAPASMVLNRIDQSLVREPSLGMLRERDGEDARRRDNTMGFAPMASRGNRTDDEELERKGKEIRQRPGVTVFEPFTNYASQPYSEAMRSSVSMDGFGSGPFRTSAMNGAVGNHDEVVGPWDNVTTASAQNTPAQSTSPVLSAPTLQGLSVDNITWSVERHTSSGSISPGTVNGSQTDSFVDPGTIEAEIAKSLNGLTLATNAGETSPQLPSPVSNSSSGGGRIIDQNPPINTLYVGNLPTGVVEQLEDKLRELFSAQPGYRRLCFRQKNNGPMCFVEFEDVHFATKALYTLQGHTLNGLVKGTGIRLSYSKNPLGVRTPTSTGGGQLQQQQSNPAMDHLQSRLNEDLFQPKPGVMRREVNPTSSSGAGNGTHSSYGNSFPASPPPRFFSSSPSALTSFSPAVSPQSISGLVPRHSSILNLYNPPPSFAPFGFSSLSQPMIPDHHITSTDEQNSANSHNVHHLHCVMSPPAANLEAARAS